ncbi:MAG: glycerol-3-phosphate 1-O-acyltransferase PlsY [Bacteroidetes bacterium]|jgi:glycerol-3-phosphate acyltransferase PlsY|nr:glycerol-3-phosphate 1-O-acyltransferase PlsY [Bacteroidota bacterium]
METKLLIGGVILSYLLGSIPSAVWIGKMMFGIDVREHGSGNAGASNTFRVLGKKAGFLVLLIDFFKGLASTGLMFLQYDIIAHTTEFRNYQMLLGLVAVLGHVYPIFAGFKGGKGIATLLGAVVGISWHVALLAAVVFILSVWITRYISVGSMLGCILSPLFVRLIYGPNETIFIYFCTLVALLVVYTHRSNIKRLREGTESKFSFSKKPEIQSN